MCHCALSCSQTHNKARGKHSLLCDIDSRRENREFVCISVPFIAQETQDVAVRLVFSLKH